MQSRVAQASGNQLEDYNMLKKTRLSLAVGAAFSAGLVGFAPNALGQAAPTTPVSGQQLDRVEITGSLIRRSEAESALPVTTISIDELQKAGVTTAQQAVTFITENQSGVVAASSVGGSNGGASYADLRGLGPQRTLVLLNGQRIVNNPYTGQAVDLNTLPTVAIARIDVLRDGASALYGTDAIAGVINIITRKEYEGISVSGQGQWPSSAGQSYAANITGGYGSLEKQGWNIFGGFSYVKQEVLEAPDRSYAASGIIPAKGVFRTSGTTFPATWFDDNGVVGNPSLTNCSPPNSVPNARATACRFDFARQVDLVPEQEIWSFLGRGTVALGANNTLSLEYFRTQNTIDTKVAPTPLVGLTMSSANPFFPGGSAGVPGTPTSDPITVNWRTTTAGQRSQSVENVTDRALLTFDGNAKGWNYNANAYYSGSKIEQSFTNGYVNFDRIDQALQGMAGGVALNPFGGQTAAGQQYLTASKILGTVQNIDGTQWGLNAAASGEIAKLPAGAMTLGVGAEYRKEEINYTNNFALIRQAASSGLELAQDTKGDRNVWALYAELDIPVIKNLNVNLALRYDDYSDVGTNTSPKIAVRYQPIDSLLLRASYNQGFRAPTLFDIYQPAQLTNTANAYNDPLLCPNGVVNTGLGGVETRDCDQQFNRQTAGNKQLEPETSDSYSFGFVFDVTREFSFSVDYWNTKIKNQILTLPDSELFSNASLNTPFYFRRCGAIPPSEASVIDVCNSGNANVLAYLNTPTDNYGDIKTNGIDLSFTVRPSATEFGRFLLTYNATYVLKYEQQLSKGGQFYNPLGNYNFELDFPVFRFQSVLNLGWQYNVWSANLFNRFRSGYTDQNDASGLTSPAYADNWVGAYSVWDLTGSWSGIKGLTISAGILNLFDNDPPFSNQGSTFQVGYDPRFASPLGRQYMLRVSYEFK
jgi:iron complex outermembrane receptor protein